jgi:hypothetical protein
MPRKIVFLEANEIPYRVMDDFVAGHPQSRLARTFSRCRQYTSIAADTCSLSPWITWPTMHRGVNNEAHGVAHFGQDLGEIDQVYPPVWRLLADAGISTGVFGPLHSWPLPGDAEKYDYYLPDTFAQTPDSYPAELTAFQNFNLVMARQSARNVSGGIDLGSFVPFILKAPGLGLRIKTLLAIAKQLLDERSDGWKRTRRRTYQPVVEFDLFMKQLEKSKPQFSHFFTNHVASAMHRCWAASNPDEYDVLELTPEWQARFGGEIEFAMGWLDDMFGRLVDFADRNPEYIVVVASSMGQEAAYGDRIETQLYLRRPEKLMQRAGLRHDEWERRPAMDPDISIVVKEDKEVPFAELGLEVVVEDEAGSTAYPIPEGTFYVYDPQDTRPKSGRPSISTTQVAPAILKHFGIERPGYMSEPDPLRPS